MKIFTTQQSHGRRFANSQPLEREASGSDMGIKMRGVKVTIQVSFMKMVPLHPRYPLLMFSSEQGGLQSYASKSDNSISPIKPSYIRPPASASVSLAIDPREAIAHKRTPTSMNRCHNPTSITNASLVDITSKSALVYERRNIPVLSLRSLREEGHLWVALGKQADHRIPRLAKLERCLDD